MNNQEQPFADPATSYGDRRPINTDPREQPQSASRLVNTDPREQPQWQAGTPPFMAPLPRRRRSPWFWLGISTLLLVLIFGSLATAAALLTHDISATKRFTVGSLPRLVVTASSSDVHIVSGAANQISVVAHEHVFLGNSDQIPIHYDLSSDGNTLTVSVGNQEPGFVFFSFNSGIDLDVTVPSQTALDIHTDSGNITSNGVNGQMSLTANSGDITTDGGSGHITLTASSGDIRASNVSGQMTLRADSGDITVSNANARGNSTFQTSSGNISYSGSLNRGLDQTETYGFRADSGDINLTLPASAAFSVQATTDSGDISSDFSGVNVLHDNGSGATASGTVGSAPYAQITMQASSGDIHLHSAG